MEDLGGTSIELKAIEECTEELTDFKQLTAEQNAHENTEDIVDKNSGNPHFENKDSSDCKIEASLPPPEANVAPKRKFSLRKKSRVEFRVKPNTTQDEAKLSTDSVNQISNVGRRFSVQAKRTRESFSGMKAIVFCNILSK